MNTLSHAHIHAYLHTCVLFLHYIRPSIHTCIHRYMVIPKEVGILPVLGGPALSRTKQNRSFLEKHSAWNWAWLKTELKKTVFILIPTLVWIPKKTINDKRVILLVILMGRHFFHWFVSKWCQLTSWFLKRGETRVAWTDAGWVRESFIAPHISSQNKTTKWALTSYH